MSDSLNDLKLDRILKIQKPFWLKLSVEIKKWILQDMIKGVCQAYSGGTGYLSATYVKYKANFMKRFTTRTYKKGTKNIAAGTTTTAGTNLKAYSGVSIRSNNVKQVNMYLTGQTIEGLEYAGSTDTSVKLSYKTKDEKKIIHNEELGRFITTLNEVNREKTIKMLEDELAKNIKNWERGRIKIIIGA